MDDERLPAPAVIEGGGQLRLVVAVRDADRQELRVKMQAIGLDAKLKQAWRTDPDGTPMAVADHVDDFSLRNLGFQVRYRYELAPLSDLYVVYGRGGYMLDEFAQGEADQLRNAFSLRDSEMLLIKLSYRFEL